MRGFRATGHAQHARRGADIVCSAATSLLRTVAAELSSHRELACSGEANEGELVLQVGAVPAARAEWLLGVTDTLRRGLDELQRDYPRSIDCRTASYRESVVDTLIVGGV